MKVYITRESREGKTYGRRVYITGPHFGEGVYSSTEDRSKGSLFAREEAERLVYIEGKWRGSSPEIEEQSCPLT